MLEPVSMEVAMDGGAEPQLRPSDLKEAGKITEEDVGALRRGMFRDGIIDWDEARMVVALHGACPERADAWDQFLCGRADGFSGLERRAAQIRG